MSRGPGRVQRAILDTLTLPEATEPFTPDLGDYDQPGPIGVPVTTVYLTLFGTAAPTRSQKVSFSRALKALEDKGTVATYQRRVCAPRNIVAPAARWDPTNNRYDCPHCWYVHLPRKVIGRPRTDDEIAAQKRRFATAMALARAALG